MFAYTVKADYAGQNTSRRLWHSRVFNHTEFNKIWADAKNRRLLRSPHMALGHPFNLVSQVVQDLIDESGFRVLSDITV